MTYKQVQLKVDELWHAGWNKLTFEEQFRFHLQAAGHVKPLIHRDAGKFCDGTTIFDVTEVDMPCPVGDETTTPFVKKSQLAQIGKAIVETMHSKETSATKKASVLSLLVGKVPDHVASKATNTGRRRMQTLKTKGPVKTRVLKKDIKRRVRNISDKQIIESLAEDTSDSCRFTSDGTQLGTVSSSR